ncbi:MAG: radical SAM protein, partial [Alphaproteobacteria bacterium]|nr:radical SAM protein [Alphaproteobacteria bacterium]
MAEVAEKYCPRQKSEDWFLTPQGEARGYIDSGDLRELWFHTGTACNLACDFCLEGSKPGDRRLQLIRFADAKPAILAALKLGVEQFSFTGGEPFVARDIVRILMLACSHRPCLLLTNGTLAVQRRKAELWPLLSNSHPVSFRVSLDHYDADIHDRGRGAGNFISALRGLKMLYDMGFSVSVARRIWQDEDKKATAAAFAKIFTDHDLPPD